ncbi:hypothetical protein C8R45DRAFT_1012911 [Mycena sanguinolenta]|nr:hypothetical protein C8R45DRAFT_1012911 [Mycena sanguinolenta]
MPIEIHYSLMSPCGKYYDNKAKTLQASSHVSTRLWQNLAGPSPFTHSTPPQVAPQSYAVLSQPVVFKMAEQDRDDPTEEEGSVYRERLRRLTGVPKLYAEGSLLADNGEWAYCLLVEDLGLPLTSEGLVTVDELDPNSRAQLAELKAKLRDRGVIHGDTEHRNILPTRTGGIALIDFENAMLLPVKKKRNFRKHRPQQ